MQRNLLFLAFLVLTIFPQKVHSQTVWFDDFGDSNITSNPLWLGDTSMFTVNVLQQLQLNAPAASATAQLYTPSSASLNGTWQFYVQLDFNPSSNNYCSIYLMSSSANVNQATNGYFLRVGGTSSDRISLYRQSGTSQTLIAESADGIVNSSAVALHVRITRDSLFNWTVLVDTALNHSFYPVATGVDGTWLSSAYFGIKCVYTSTRSDKFFFDDFFVNGSDFTDTQPPTIIDLAFTGPNDLTLTFSEPIDSASATKPGNYSLTPNATNPQIAYWLNSKPDAIQLHFQDPFSNNATYQLRVEEIEDLFGNALTDTLVFFNFYRPGYRTVVINEIMADPEPVVGLPAAEYLELYNTTDKTFYLKNWKLVLDEDTISLPVDTLPAFGFRLIVSTAQANLFSAFPALALPLGSSWLRNSGETILLLDENNALIDGVTFTEDWYQNNAKTAGGWSLTQIEPELPCSEPANWCASNHPSGGTPAAINLPESTQQIELNEIKAIYQPAPNSLEIQFTRAFSPQQLPVITSTWNQPIINYSPLQPNFLRLAFAEDLPPNPIELILEAGTSCSSPYWSDTIHVGAIQALTPKDIVLNELLFNPKPNGTDFIEIWNTSTKTLLLADFRLAELDENNALKDVFVLSEEPMVVLPKSFLVLSADETQVCTAYDCSKTRFFHDMQMPSMPDSEGRLALIRPDLTIIEWVSYADDWHHPSITNPEGVSLERVSPLLDSDDALTWHSASTDAGYATPGRMNSQFNAANANQGRFKLSSETLSPNNDGYNDVLQIGYTLPAGAMLSVHVFSLNGVVQATLADNILAAPEGTLIWNGSTDQNQLAPTGIYVILLEWFTPDGTTGKTKRTVALSL